MSTGRRPRGKPKSLENTSCNCSNANIQAYQFVCSLLVGAYGQIRMHMVLNLVSGILWSRQCFTKGLHMISIDQLTIEESFLGELPTFPSTTCSTMTKPNFAHSRLFQKLLGWRPSLLVTRCNKYRFQLGDLPTLDACTFHCGNAPSKGAGKGLVGQGVMCM